MKVERTTTDMITIDVTDAWLGGGRRSRSLARFLKQSIGQVAAYLLLIIRWRRKNQNLYLQQVFGGN